MTISMVRLGDGEPLGMELYQGGMFKERGSLRAEFLLRFKGKD